ncbi:MAG: bacillithiol biosynthesis cysteine-adding enzyme BshC [Sediminibacterium sp.]|uniref:bacillithiol biosynthesis cysteine-adding enzyme BshC n=1 Tax=Sediminibacterium sp. TaxID=1917865 RepID=UPI002ABC6EA8|nr:bacillithiol biosynthesis cysteine-adding enzyme BshC [Sediminibacterium sp.]MDZ4070800.1 bacillithiol biosynthesis cysteine-adding enzyme BshC [Sediminibacterium sp.]
MKHHCSRLSYESTGYFSKIVTDYLVQADTVRPFFVHTPDIQGIKKAIAARQSFQTPRTVLVKALEEQYAQTTTSALVQQQIQSLLSEQTFTVVTAHQPNIFTGPLYFIYKILHAIQLADVLKKEMPDLHFVPVYYMGSEDADLDELGQINIDGHPLTWKTNQTGAVGRMKADKKLLELLAAIEGQTGVHPYGKVLTDIFRNAYVEGRSIQEATLYLVNELFGRFGLVVLIPDQAKLKQCFASVIEKELLEGFSHTIVSKTIIELEKNYKVQAGGREINLFYLIDNQRERIEKGKDRFVVPALGLQFTKEQILEELQTHPERFSPNVILRGAFQETILPNIAFIGGGGELAYWLELKDVFAAIHVPYPVLVLRNSFLILTAEQEKRMEQLALNTTRIFQKADLLLNALVKERTSKQLTIKNELHRLEALYRQIEQVAADVDQTLSPHVQALQVQAVKKIQELEKKMLRAEKRKFETEERQLNQFKQQLFPNNSLQERIDNLSGWYSRYGSAWIDMLKAQSLALESEFSIVVIA